MRFNMILIFSNPSIFTLETADMKLAYLQSAVPWANFDEFKKFKILAVLLNLMMEKMKNYIDFACFL